MAGLAARALENPRVTPQGAERDLRNTALLMPWLRELPRRLQVATDVDVAGMTPEALCALRRPALPGHSEYVPPRLFWLVRRYRDGGGRIAMLSANGFYRHVAVAPDDRVVADPRPLRRRARSDRSLLGSAYITCCFAARPGYAVQRGARRRAVALPRHRAAQGR